MKKGPWILFAALALITAAAYYQLRAAELARVRAKEYLSRSEYLAALDGAHSSLQLALQSDPLVRRDFSLKSRADRAVVRLNPGFLNRTLIKHLSESLGKETLNTCARLAGSIQYQLVMRTLASATLEHVQLARDPEALKKAMTGTPGYAAQASALHGRLLFRQAIYALTLHVVDQFYASLNADDLKTPELKKQYEHYFISKHYTNAVTRLSKSSLPMTQAQLLTLPSSALEDALEITKTSDFAECERSAVKALLSTLKDGFDPR